MKKKLAVIGALSAVVLVPAQAAWGAPGEGPTVADAAQVVGSGQYLAVCNGSPQDGLFGGDLANTVLPGGAPPALTNCSAVDAPPNVLASDAAGGGTLAACDDLAEAKDSTVNAGVTCRPITF